MQYTKINLSTYVTAPSLIDWMKSDKQPDFDVDSLLFKMMDSDDFTFGGLTTYDDKKMSFPFRVHNETSTTRLHAVRDGLRSMCLKFTPNDQYTELHLDEFKSIQSKNPNHFDAEGVISAVINIAAI